MPFRMIKRLLHRWSSQQETALWQMTNRKTMGKRIEGYGKSERIEAKFFLLAAVPMTTFSLASELGWVRGSVWDALFYLSVVWAIGIFAVMFASLWRAFRRSLRDWRNGS